MVYLIFPVFKVVVPLVIETNENNNLITLKFKIMKNTITLTALFLLASTGLFAATSIKTNSAASTSPKDAISFSSLPSERGIAVKVENSEAAKAIVIIYDQDGNVLRKDVLSNGKGMEKAYILNKLDNGDYTMEVSVSKQVIIKAIHVYDEGQRKMFIIRN
jgi:hypothetical protein